MMLKLVSGWMTKRPLVNSVHCLECCQARVLLSHYQSGYLNQHFLLCFCFSGNIYDWLWHLNFSLYFGRCLFYELDVKLEAQRVISFFFYFCFCSIYIQMMGFGAEWKKEVYFEAEYNSLYSTLDYSCCNIKEWETWIKSTNKTFLSSFLPSHF